MEQNLGDFAKTYNQGIWIASFIFAALLVFRFVMVFKNKQTRKWIFSAGADWFVVAVKILFFFGLLAFLADVPVWFITVATFRPIAAALPQHIFLFVLISLAVQELILCFTVSDSLRLQFIKRILFTLVSIFCSFAFLLAAFIVPGTFAYPPAEDCVMLDLPVAGTWLAMHAGKEKWVNYHSNYPPQAYAIDMVKLNEEGNFFLNGGSVPADFLSYGDSVFAPIDGVVYNMADSFETQKVYHGEDTLNPAGNFIELELAGGKYLFLAHLQKGSIRVKKGDTVKSGMYLGNAGNSGNTTFPHLHMHIQNKPTINDTLALGQPFRFNKLERKRFFTFMEYQNTYLNRNDQFRN